MRCPKKRGSQAWLANLFHMVPMTGIELVTYALRVRCSTN